jgi:hypothetical protein
MYIPQCKHVNTCMHIFVLSFYRDLWVSAKLLWREWKQRKWRYTCTCTYIYMYSLAVNGYTMGPCPFLFTNMHLYSHAHLEKYVIGGKLGQNFPCSCFKSIKLWLKVVVGLASLIFIRLCFFAQIKAIGTQQMATNLYSDLFSSMCVGWAYHVWHAVQNVGVKIFIHEGHVGLFLCTNRKV